MRTVTSGLARGPRGRLCLQPPAHADSMNAGPADRARAAARARRANRRPAGCAPDRPAGHRHVARTPFCAAGRPRRRRLVAAAARRRAVRHRHRYFDVLARTAAYAKFPLRPRTAGAGRERQLASRDRTAGIAALLPSAARSSTSDSVIPVWTTAPLPWASCRPATKELLTLYSYRAVCRLRSFPSATVIRAPASGCAPDTRPSATRSLRATRSGRSPGRRRCGNHAMSRSILCAIYRGANRQEHRGFLPIGLACERCCNVPCSTTA